MISISTTWECHKLGRSDLRPQSPLMPFNSLACGQAQSLNLRGESQNPAVKRSHPATYNLETSLSSQA